MKDEVRIAYGAQDLNTKEKFEEAEIIKNISKEQQELITSIIKIELDKGNKISTQSALKVLSFLLKLAFPSRWKSVEKEIFKRIGAVRILSTNFHIPTF